MSIAPGPAPPRLREVSEIANAASGISAGPQSARATGTQAAGADLLPFAKLCRWLGKSFFSLADQGLTSLTGFSVSFLLARWLAPESYGAYAIAFAAYLFICGFHNALILEPMSVLGAACHADELPRYFRAQITVHAVLVAVLATVAAFLAAVTSRVAPHSALAGAILGSALALPFLLLLWLARRMCYVLQRPRIAIFGSASCLAIAVAGLYALRYKDWLTPFTAFLLIGAGSLVGSSLILRSIHRHGEHRNPRHGSDLRSYDSPRIPWRLALRENWTYGRWIAGTAMLYPISGQVQMFLVAALLGLGSAGILRAMMIPAAVMTQVVTAADLLILPGFSYDFGRGAEKRMRRRALLISGVLGGSGLCFAALLWLSAATVEQVLFHGKFAAYSWLIPVLALIPAVNGINSGFSATLRGSQKPHFDLLANAVAAPIAALSALLFIRAWGLAGAAASMVAGFAALAAVNGCAYVYLARRNVHLRAAPVSQTPAPSFENGS